MAIGKILRYMKLNFFQNISFKMLVKVQNQHLNRIELDYIAGGYTKLDENTPILILLILKKRFLLNLQLYFNLKDKYKEKKREESSTSSG